MRKWRLLKSNAVLSSPWLSVFKNRYQVSGHQIIDDYYIVRRNDFALVVAVEESKLILVREYRPATDRFYLALPGGYLEPGEAPNEGAKRELLEETGFFATKCTLIGELHPLPGYIQSRAFVLLCEVSSARREEVERPAVEEVVKLGWDEAVEKIVGGEINEMQAVSAILLAREVLSTGARQAHR